MDENKKSFLKRLIKRTLETDAKIKSEQKKQQQLEDHISALEKMTDLKRSKITEIANEIILEDKEDSHSHLKKSSPIPTGTYAIYIALMLLVAIFFLILNYTPNKLAPQLTAIKTDISANNTSDIKAIVVDTLPTRELPIVPEIEYEIKEIKKETPKVRLITTGATKTWGDDLNPQNEMPLNSFNAFYFNTNNRKEVIATSHVKQVAIKYSYKDLHGIDSKYFGAYWVGMFEFTEDQALQFNIHLSWASTRIIVDGFVVYEGGSKTKVPYVFTQGRHKIEVEFTNNWHTTNFSAVLE